jgi:hypothetical protein
MSEEILEWIIRTSGVGLLVLASIHRPIAEKLNWNEDVKKLSPENQSVFHSHLFFICFGITLLGLTLTFVPSAFVEKSALGRVISLMLFVFWLVRLIRQWCAFPWSLWKGKRLETFAHFAFTLVWCALVMVFGLLGWWQFQG